MYRYIYICIIIYMIYTQPHSNIPDVHHFKVQFETKCQSIRHFSSFSWIPESHDIPRYPSLQLPISEWCAPNNLGPESGGSWSNAKLSENWAPMEFVTVSPVEKGCWWSFYWKNIMRNIYLYIVVIIYIYIWYTYMKKKRSFGPPSSPFLASPSHSTRSTPIKLDT